MTLSAHINTKRVSEAEVMAVPAPVWTPTWHPIAHREVVTSLDSALKQTGIDVLNREYSLSKNGAKMFGSWALALGTGKVGFELGIRNGIDKSMSVGVCAGNRVFVCDNLAFSGSYIMFRKHTSGLDHEEMTQIAIIAVQRTVPKMEALLEWHNKLPEVAVPMPDFKALVFDMMTTGVFSPDKLNSYLHCLDEEKGGMDKAMSLQMVHGAATRLMKGWSLLRTARASASLEQICDGYMTQKS